MLLKSLGPEKIRSWCAEEELVRCKLTVAVAGQMCSSVVITMHCSAVLGLVNAVHSLG